MNVPLHTTLADAARFLQRERLSYALIGGVAASLRGEPRITADVDLVVDASIDRALELAGRLDGTAFQPLFADVADVIQRSFLLPLRHRSTKVKVDVTIGLTGFERQTIGRANLMDVGGSMVPVASAEDLLIMKVLAGRPRDQDDVQGIIDAQGERLDWEYCLTTARQLEEATGQDLVGPLRALRTELRNDE